MAPPRSTAVKAKTATEEPVSEQDELDVEIADSAVKAKTAPRGQRRASTAKSMFAAMDDHREFARIVAYGKEGSTKTTSALTASQNGRVLLINAEGGIKKNALRQHGVNTANVAMWPAEPGEAITQRKLDGLFRQIKSDLAADPDAWYAVVMDSATDIVEQMVSFVQTNRVDKIRKRSGEDSVDEVDAFFTDRADYGTMSKMMLDVIRKFRDLPCHLIITALERKDQDKDEGGVKYGPAVSPAVQTPLLGYSDMVLAYKAPDEDGPARALTKRTSLYRCKDRNGVLPMVLAEPTFIRILAYIEGELTPETDPVQATLKAAPAEKTGKKSKKSTRKTPTPENDEEKDD